MAAAAGDAHLWPIYNARFRVVFPLLDADGDLVTGATTPDSELSQDQGTFADATNEATEIATSSGMYYLDLIATELDTKSTAIIVKSATAGMKTTPMVLYPKRLPVLRTGTAQAGGASTITLDSGASALNSFYNGCYVNVTNNSPANALGQARRITGYVGSTKVATVEAAWGTNPDVTSTFEVLFPGDAVQVNGFLGTEVAITVAGVPKVDVSTWDGTDITTGVPLAPATAGRTLVVDAAGLADANVVKVGPTGVGTVQTAGDIMGDTNDIQTRLPAALVGGRMDSSVGAMAADVVTAAAIANGAIDAATFVAGAIDAAAIATDAIGAAELADGAITALTFAAGAIDAAAIATGAIDADAIAADAIGASELAADAVDEIWDEAMTELAQAAPSATPAMRALLAALYMALRNQVTVTSTTKTFSNDAGTVVFKKALTDDGTTYAEAETATGP